MKYYEAIAQTLKNLQIKTIFGLVGDANLFVVNAFIKDCNGDYVGAANEAGAALMALGYASVSGQVGIATVTCGPGFTNTITPLIEGVKSHIPMVLIAGRAPARDKYSPQKICHRDFALAAGAGYEKAESITSACSDLVTAYRRAEAEQRPIVFDMPPYDLLHGEADHELPKISLTTKRFCEISDSPDLDIAIGIIAMAKRPLIITGHGAVKDGAREEILNLARRIDAPIMTTLRAKDLYYEDPLNLDIFGYSAHPSTTEVVMACDCIISFGASLNFITTMRGDLFQGKRTISINNELDDLGKHIPLDAQVLADCKSAARKIVHWLDEAEIAPSLFASEELVRNAANAIRPNFSPLDANWMKPTAEDRLELPEVYQEISHALKNEYILATGLGRHAGYTWHAFHVSEPRLFVPGHSFGAIGLTLSLAIGAAKAEPKLATVVTTGDGAFMLGDMSEFNTAVRYGLNLIVVLCNDGSYGAEYEQFALHNMEPSVTIFEWPDFASVAKSLGGASVTLRSRSDLAIMRSAIENRNKRTPLLIDIRKEPDSISRFQGSKIS